MTRLFSIILNLVHLLKNQGHHKQGSINQEHDAEDSKAQLELLRTALKQIETEAKADRALKNEELRLERATLVFVIVGVVGAFVNLFYLKASVDITGQQLKAMYSTTQIQQRAHVNVHNIELVAFKAGKSPEALISYKNSGPTPANNVAVIPDSSLFEWPTSEGSFPMPPSIMEDYQLCPPKWTGSILPPGVARTVNTMRMMARRGPLGPLTNKSVQDMRHMVTRWYVVVYILYIDAFGDCHRSVEPFEFDPFTQTFNPTSENAIPDQRDNHQTKSQY